MGKCGSDARKISNYYESIKNDAVANDKATSIIYVYPPNIKLIQRWKKNNPTFHESLGKEQNFQSYKNRIIFA